MKKGQKLNNFRNKFEYIRGFTLAEVIIVIGIIGIIAEMTIPTLIQQQQDAQMVAGTLKFVSSLQQAIDMWKQETGCYESAYRCMVAQGIPTDAGSGIVPWNDFLGTIGKHMNIVKRTTDYGDYADIDWLPDLLYSYRGTPQTDVSVFDRGGPYKGGSVSNGIALLADGSTLSIQSGATGSGCMELRFDVNGKKPPNRMGKDYYRLVYGCNLGNKDLHYCYAFGTAANADGLCNCWDDCDPNNTDPNVGDGAMPLSYVLLNHKLPSY